jgi:hypothetical protein
VDQTAIAVYRFFVDLQGALWSKANFNRLLVVE